MRTHYCGQVNETLIGSTVTVAGWVHRRRDHGGVIFVDLRDREGLVQIVCDPDAAEVFAEAEKLRNEFVVSITGLVRARPEGTTNANLASGKIEMLARHIELLNRSEPLPFQLDENVSEEVRLKYRYLDLRRDVMSQRLRQRHEITKAMRHYLDDAGFVDIETPMLTKATPEGARDYLVPSRTHAGKFFALPQSPQIFKQLLMVSGFDRYYQIARCFRDEDLRADRQPDFTQLDIETSFLSQDQIMDLMEGLIRHIFTKVAKVELPNPFPRMTYAEAMRRYASDKPDLRIPLELVDVADLVADCDFKVFAGPAKDPNGRVAALRVPGAGKLTRKEIDGLTKVVAEYGAKGLAISIHALGRAIDGIAEIQVPRQPKTTFNVGRIGGGTSVNSIAFEAWMEVDMRSETMVALEAVKEQFMTSVNSAVEAENKRWGGRGNLSVELELVGLRPAGETSQQSPIIKATNAAVVALGLQPIHSAGSTDSNVPMNLGVPAVTIGGGGSGFGAHALDEYFDSTDSHLGPQMAILLLAALTK